MPDVAPAPVPRRKALLIGDSQAMRALEVDIQSAARSSAKVLLTGETGVGKEIVARTIHERSARQRAPLVTINCAGVPDSLLESELFGHTRGSFTDAHRDNPGLLRHGHKGTVFLDEVGEMSLRMQSLLLRFLETGEIQTVGSGMSQVSHVDVRIITATNRDLAEAVGSRAFREDLYYRLNVLHIRIPPLRERGRDVELLTRHYVETFANEHGVPTPLLSEGAVERLVAYSWPGNVRELRNLVERLVLRTKTEIIEPLHLPEELLGSGLVGPDPSDGATVSHEDRVERLWTRLVTDQTSFWTAVYPLFMTRDITRDDLRYLVGKGLERTQGSYRLLLALFNMAPEDYKRFLGFLNQHDCHLPFQRFRIVTKASAPEPSRRSLPAPLV
jgi:transcriptional regulator with GAF, ATPase, and Fis domain